jgi:hypothetical protein
MNVLADTVIEIMETLLDRISTLEQRLGVDPEPDDDITNALKAAFGKEFAR